MNSYCSKDSSLALALHRCRLLLERCASTSNFTHSFYPSLAAVSTHFDKYRASALGVAAAGSGVGEQSTIGCPIRLSSSRWCRLPHYAPPTLLSHWLCMVS